MTATDELRLPNYTKELDTLLYERGKEHRVWPSGLVIWHDEGSWVYEYSPPKGDDDYWGGILHATLRHCTPEQAIEATLGRGECFADDALENENARLRELVEDMLDCIEIREAFGRPLTPEMYDGFAQRAGELGIEV